MPLQTTLQVYPTSLQLGHEATTQSQFRFSFQAYADLINASAAPIPYGSTVTRQADGTWALISAANLTNQKAIVMWDYRLSSKIAYLPTEPLNLMMVGDIVIQTIAGITVKAGDPLFVYNTGATVGQFTNVLDAIPANTTKVPGFFLEDKASTNTLVGIVFNFMV